MLGVQFEPLPIMAPHIGLFWSQPDVRNQFRTVKQQPALEPFIERFGVKATVQPSAGFKLMDEPETPRCWLIEEGGNRLIQVQADRFIHNWRALEESDAYPHYATIRAAFVEELKRFEAFLVREGLGSLKPNQCEVTYINRIRPSGVWENFGQADRVFPQWAPPQSSGSLPAPEDVRFGVRYVISDTEGKPLGRLHVNVQPAYLRKDEGEVFAMNLMARGSPEGEGIAGVMKFLDRGHELIVLGFTELTAPAMHRVWGKHGP